MQLKISKTLEGIIARSAFNTTKAGMTHSLKDFLVNHLPKVYMKLRVIKHRKRAKVKN